MKATISPAHFRRDLCLLLLMAAPVVAHRPALDRPNFVLLFVDDLGYGDCGFTGNPTTRTPNIDNLAFKGKVLTTWYSGCSVCSCSRATLLTGRQYGRYGMKPILGPTENIGLNLEEITMAEQLKQANYATAMVGKYHLGQREAYLPANQGFDFYLGIPYSNDMGDAIYSTCDAEGKEGTQKPPTVKCDPGSDNCQPPEQDKLSRWPGLYLPLVYQQQNQTRIIEQPLDLTTLAQKYNDFAINFIKTNKDSPFFLYVPFSHVHATSGRNAHNETLPHKQYANCQLQNKTKRGLFGDALAEVDWMVGNIRETLKELGLEENTLILFTSDNGPWTGRFGDGGSVGIFSGNYANYRDTGKGSTWEGGIRMPAFVYWKGQISPHSRSSETISTMDVFPTFSRLANVPLPANLTLDGRDMTDIMLRENGKSKHDFLFFYGFCNGEWPRFGPSAVRHGSYKAHFCTQSGFIPGFDGAENVIHYDKYPLLFNVDEDPSEAFPLCTGDVPPVDREAAAALTRIQRAYAMEKATFQYGEIHTIPDAPEESPGQYGVCCNRDTNCNCEGKGLFHVGTRGHHDAYHDIIGEVNHMKGGHGVVHARMKGKHNKVSELETKTLNQASSSLHGHATLAFVAACSMILGVILTFLFLRHDSDRRHQYDRIPGSD